jgi:hypothetical protein
MTFPKPADTKAAANEGDWETVRRLSGNELLWSDLLPVFEA